MMSEVQALFRRASKRPPRDEANQMVESVTTAIAISGAGTIVMLGELARRAVLGRRLEHEMVEARGQEVAEVHSGPTWRLLRTESEFRAAVDRAIASEQASRQRYERRAQRYDTLRSHSVRRIQ
jgi:hypothetical protein